MGRKTRKCPYCKSKVSYLSALSEINSGEHTCRNCYKNSNISYNKMIYIPAVIALVIAIIVAAMFFVFKIIKNLILALVLILVPFAVFYFITPLFFSLEEIKNEAQIPIMFEPKRAARAEKQSRTLKSDEIAKADNAKKEQKSIEKKKSVGGKFAKFVRTYIIVPDDEEDNDEKSHLPKSDNKSDENSGFLIVEEDETEQNISVSSETKNISEQKKETIVNIVSENIVSHSSSENDIHNETEKTEDKPKLNFNKLFSKLNFSENKKTDTPTNNSVSESKPNETVNIGEPVYHRLTKTNKVNFIYYMDKRAIISVDLNVTDEKTQEDKPDVVEFVDNIDDTEIEITENLVEQENNDVTEAIEMVVEKTLEVEKDEEENREIINFFAEKPDESEEEEFGENDGEADVTETKNDNIGKEEIEKDWVEYKPETGDFITLNFDRPENNVSKNDIISLSDVSFDIPESEDIENIDDVTEENFIDYDNENKLPFIVVEDSAKKISELDRQLFEKNPTQYEWNVFSAEKVDFKPEIVDFNNNLINTVVDDEIDYKAEFEIFSQNVTENISMEKSVTENSQKSENNDNETKDKHKFGLFSKYVSKIKNESVFNFEKSVDSNEESDAAPTEILEFKEELPEEVKVDEVIKFDFVSPADENKEQISIITADEYIENTVTENAEDNGFVTDETAEPDKENDFPDIADIEEFIEAEPDEDDILNNVTKLDAVNISVTNTSDENVKAELPEDFLSEADFVSEDINELDEEDVVNDDGMISEDEFITDEISEKETSFDMDYDFVANEVGSVQLESTEISENENSDDESEVFVYNEFSVHKNIVEDEPVDVEKNDDYYTFDEDDDEEISEEDDDYYRFDEEYDEVPEKDDDYYRFDEEDDEEINEVVEGAIEYIPEDKSEDNYVVDYSYDKNEGFEDISSGEQLDENFNLEEFRAMSTEENPAEEKVVTEPIIPVKIDSSGNRIADVSEKTSRYEKKFPGAVKAAAEQAAALEVKKQREKNKAKKKKSAGETVKKNVPKTNESQKKDSPKKEPQKSKKTPNVQEQKTGFFSGLKNKIIEATEEERQAAFEEEERERKLAEKEARRKAKEKEKAEKLKAQKEKTKSYSPDNSPKDSKPENPEKTDAEERKRKSQKTKRIEKSKVKIPSDVPADGKTIVFDSSEKVNDKEYQAQEKIVLDSVKDKVRELENKKVTEAEKVKIISEKVDEEKRLEKIEKLKSEQEEQRVKKEKKRREIQLQNERLEKAEEIRREQVKQVRKNQSERNKSEEKRDTNNVSLKEVDNVRSKVSQKKKKRKKEINEVL